MWKRYVIALSLFLSAVLSCHADESRPNILFFFADDQRHDTLGCAGHKIVKTPTIDRLANSGLILAGGKNMGFKHGRFLK